MSGIATRQMTVLDTFKAHAIPKTNPQAAALTVAEIASITGLTRRAAQAGAAGLMRRGLLIRLQTGLYAIAEKALAETQTTEKHAQRSRTLARETFARETFVRKPLVGETSPTSPAQASHERSTESPHTCSEQGNSPSDLCLRSGPQRSFTGIRRVKQPTMKDRYWQVMRIKPVFTLADLMMVSGPEGRDKRAYANAMRFTNHLLRAGLVRRLSHRTPGHSPTSNGYCRYQLLWKTRGQKPLSSDRPELPSMIQTARNISLSNGPETGERHLSDSACDLINGSGNSILYPKVRF